MAVKRFKCWNSPLRPNFQLWRAAARPSLDLRIWNSHTSRPRYSPFRNRRRRRAGAITGAAGTVSVETIEKTTTKTPYIAFSVFYEISIQNSGKTRPDNVSNNIRKLNSLAFFYDFLRIFKVRSVFRQADAKISKKFQLWGSITPPSVHIFIWQPIGHVNYCFLCFHRHQPFSIIPRNELAIADSNLSPFKIQHPFKPNVSNVVSNVGNHKFAQFSTLPRWHSAVS